MNWASFSMDDATRLVFESLAHFCWQGVLIAAVVMLVAYAYPAATAAWRDGALVCGLGLMAICPLATLGVLSSRPILPAPGIAAVPSLPVAADRHQPPSFASALEPGGTSEQPNRLRPAQNRRAATVAGTPPQSAGTTRFRPDWVRLSLFAYLSGVAVLMLRLGFGALGTRRLIHGSQPPVSARLESAIRNAAQRVGFRRLPHVRICEGIAVPAVVGTVRAVVLVPAALASQLSPDELEAILVHELLHLRRWDHWINLGQRLVEAALFFHPAVWLLSRQIRLEREFACDDAVLALGTANNIYASSLLTVAMFSQNARRPETARALSEVAAVRPSISQLRQRLHRILGEPLQMSIKLTHLDCWSLLVTLLILLSLPLGLHLQAKAKTTVAQEPTPAVANGQEPTTASWGEPVNGLSCRIVPVSFDSDEQQPESSKALSEAQFETGESVTLRVEIKNVSDQPIDLCHVRYNENWTPPAPGKSNSNWYAPLMFDLVILNDGGQVVEQARPAFGVTDQMMLISGVQVPKIAPGEAMQLLLRPGAWDHGLRYRLAAGDHRLQVVYRGFPSELKQDLAEPWVDKPFAKAWSGKVISNVVAVTVERDAEQGLPPRVWGEANNGLRAATRLLPVKDAYPYGTRLAAEFHVQNVSDDVTTFWTETWRQDDVATLTMPDGKQSALRGSWYSGMAILVQWTLKPGQIARLTAADIGIAADQEAAAKFKHPTGRIITGPTGKYQIVFTLSIGRLQRQDADGNVVVPGPDDWTGELSTAPIAFQVREPVAGDFPEPITFEGRLQLRSTDGGPIDSGFVKIWDRQSGEFETQEVSVEGSTVTIANCVERPLVVDIRVPGFEEQRFYEVVFKPDESVNLDLKPTVPATFRLTDVVTGEPIAGAKVRFFRRTASKSVAGPYPTDGIRGPVWAVSNERGQVVLDTLRRVDPFKPDNGDSLYHFYVEPPEGTAPCYVGPLKVGQDVGEIKLGGLLEVSGTVTGTAAELDEFRAEWDQPELIKGGVPEARWWYAVSERLETKREGDKLTFRLTGLRPGKLRVVGRFARGGSSISHVNARREPTEDDWVFELDLQENLSNWNLNSTAPKRPDNGSE